MSKKKKRVKEKQSTSGLGPGVFNSVIHPDAAGIDIGAQELVAAVPAGRSAGGTVRSFSSFTSGVHALRDWLLECGIKTVAMESTGNYWITAYAVIEDAGIEVCLVNARHVKGVPGRKTDVQDAQWLQQLHAAGLLRKSFRPDKTIVPLRYLMRHRSEMVAEGTRQLHLIQKVLTEMNLHIQHVFSDIDGLSAQNIITAILAGERDPAKLAALRDHRCRSSQSKIIEALQGDYRAEYLFVLAQCQQRRQQISQSLLACDAQIAVITAGITSEVCGEGAMPAPARKAQHHLQKNSLNLPIFAEGWRFYGVDLSTVPGVGSGLVGTFMSELGTGAQIQRAFLSANSFASWLGLCPDNRISGGKTLKAKTRKVVSRVATALRLCAHGLNNAQNKLGEYSRRMKARLGKAEGITATAHKLARILYAVITTRKVYDETQAFQQSVASKNRHLRNLQKQAAKLGFTLLPAQ